MFYYVALEPYKERYTYQLLQWTESRLKEKRIPYTVVEGQTLDDSKAIKTGQVLDAFGRSYYSLTQMAKLVELCQKMTDEDVIFFEDMFTPGVESLPYIFDQLPSQRVPRVFVRCLAQTIDPDDFVNYTGMFRWMHLYEKMVNSFVTGILCTNEEMVAYAKAAGWTNLYNIGGLSFGIKEVRSRVTQVEFNKRPMQVVFASRLAAEKQIPFMLRVFRRVKQLLPNVSFVICSGSVFRTNDPSITYELIQAQTEGLITLRSDLSKNEYYKELTNSRVMFNSSLQDWTSNTVSEADALGCNVVFPAYRSFPEVFQNDETRLYVPWSVEDAAQKIVCNLYNPHPRQGEIAEWNDRTIDRYLDLIYKDDEKYDRNFYDYRSHVNGLY